MASIPKVSIRFTDTYKAALAEIISTIENFRALDDLHDTYMIEAMIREASLVDGEDIFPEDYDFGLDLESLYINISDLPTLKLCNFPTISLLEYTFKESHLKLWVHVTNDDQSFIFVQVPLTHLVENARHY